MNKNQIRKEISALIDSIKDHSDSIGDKQHITQLELELILSKVKKLYEKSIIYNYLNSLPSPHTLHTLDVVTNEMPSKASMGTIGQHRTETITNVDLAKPSTLSLSEEASTPIVKPIPDQPVSAAKNFPALKSLIGINEKFQLINLLFNKDANAFNEALTQIDALQSHTAATDYLKILAAENKWDIEQEIYIAFLNILEKKYN